MADQNIETTSGISVPSSTVTRLVARFIVPLVLIVFAVPFVVLLFYSSPATDDFCKATLAFQTVPQRSVLAVTWLYYTQWSPRWLTTFIQSAVMSHVNLVGMYGWLLLSVVIANLAALWYFFRAVLRFSRTRSLLAAAVFYVAWVASITHPTQQLYWLTGSTEYNLCLSTMLILVGLLFRPRSTVWYYLAISLLAIAVPAQHEVAGMFTCALLLGGLIILQVKGLPARQWFVGFGMAMLSMVVVLVSPGNSLRAVQEDRHLWDLAHAPHWVAHAFYHGIGWLTLPAVLVAACCIVLLSDAEQKTESADVVPLRWLAVACLVIMFVAISESAFVEIATSSWLPPRVEELFQFIFWLAFVCLILTGVPEIHPVRISHGTRIGIFALFGVMILGSTNFRWAMSDVRGPAQAWWRVNTSRLKQRGGSLEFEAPTEYPNLTMPQLLTPDSQCWVNRCLADYLQAETVTVKNSKEECPH